MGGRLFLGNQMVTPVIVQNGGEENPLFPIKDGVITKDVSNGINAVGVKEVGDFGLFGSFFAGYGFSSLDEPFGYYIRGSASFPDLEKVGKAGMKETFENQYNLLGLFCPKLRSIGVDGMSNVAPNYSSTSLIDERFEVNFDSLEDIGEYGLESAFAYRPLKYLLLPSLKAENFTNESDYQFSDMLYEVNNCSVYFPSEFQSVIGSWGVVAGGFHGSGTSVFFWIPTKININLAQENAAILTNDKVFDNVIFGVGETVKYVVTDTSLNKNYLGTELDCVEGGQDRSVSIDLDSLLYNKITIRTNMSVSGPVLLWNNISIPLKEESDKVYSTYLSETVGETVTFYRKASSEGPQFTYDITTTGNDVDISVSLPIISDFDYPTLSSNGVLGGDSFAVSATTDVENAYKIFDRDDNTFWENNNSSILSDLIIYNPNPFLCSLFAFFYTGGLAVTMLQCSDNGVDWVDTKYDLTDLGTMLLFKMDGSSNYMHKYYKFSFVPKSGKNIKLTNIIFSSGKEQKG